jgi:predicted nucleotidyltransferase
MTVKSYLSQISNKAIIRDSEKESIKLSINTLSSRLDSYFGSKINDHFIFGSYQRGTALPRTMDNSSDVDYMIVFSNKSYNPQTYLDKLRRFATNRYYSSEIKQSHPTIILSLNHINFELVPALKRLSWNDSYSIPDKASSYNKWIDTTPLSIEKKLINANKECDYLIKPVIRMLKYWNASRNYPLESYQLEKDIIAGVDPFFMSFNNKLEDYFFDFAKSLRIGFFAPQWKRDELNRLNQLSKDAYSNWKNGYENNALKSLKKILPPL